MNFVADLSSRRLVNPSNTLVGLRKLPLTEGVSYQGRIDFVSGGSPVFGTVTNLQITVAENCEGSVPVLSYSGATGANYSLLVSSVALDYALRNKTEGDFKTSIRFDLNGTTYALDAIGTPIFNEPSVKASTSFVQSGDLAGYVKRTELAGATGLMFGHSLASGASSSWVAFPVPFSAVPKVTYTLNVPAGGSLYLMGSSGISTSGFYVLFSDGLDKANYSLSVFAR